MPAKVIYSCDKCGKDMGETPFVTTSIDMRLDGMVGVNHYDVNMNQVVEPPYDDDALTSRDEQNFCSFNCLNFWMQNVLWRFYQRVGEALPDFHAAKLRMDNPNQCDEEEADVTNAATDQLCKEVDKCTPDC